MLPHVPLLAFGFANLLMLGWLAAAAAPMLIHLWNKRRYREVSWAAIEYLLAAMRKNSRRMRIEQLLLLLVRTAIIVLLVLAVAQPYLEQLGLPFVAGQRTLKVLVIDGSYSMAYKPTDKSRFDRAKELAEQIVDESAEGDAFTLVLMGSPPEVIVGTPAVEPAGFSTRSKTSACRTAAPICRPRSRRSNGSLRRPKHEGLARVEVYFLTDLGRNTWALSPAGRDEVRQRLERLAQRASLGRARPGTSRRPRILPITDLGDRRAVCHDVARHGACRPRFAISAVSRRRTSLSNCSSTAAASRRAMSTSPRDSRRQVTFNHRFDAPGDHVVEVRSMPDLLDVDNHRWLSVPVKEHLRVLCVNGKPGTTPMTGATDYLALALNPAAGDAPVRRCDHAGSDCRKCAG